MKSPSKAYIHLHSGHHNWWCHMRQVPKFLRLSYQGMCVCILYAYYIYRLTYIYILINIFPTPAKYTEERRTYITISIVNAHSITYQCARLKNSIHLLIKIVLQWYNWSLWSNWLLACWYREWSIFLCFLLKMEKTKSKTSFSQFSEIVSGVPLRSILDPLRYS